MLYCKIHHTVNVTNLLLWVSMRVNRSLHLHLSASPSIPTTHQMLDLLIAPRRRCGCDTADVYDPCLLRKRNCFVNVIGMAILHIKMLMCVCRLCI